MHYALNIFQQILLHKSSHSFGDVRILNMAKFAQSLNICMTSSVSVFSRVSSTKTLMHLL